MPLHPRRRTRWIGTAMALFFCCWSRDAFAHPMGNFSVNHYAKIKIGQTSVEILYLVDRAEIPTYQEMRQFGITTAPEDPADSRYLDREQARLKQGLILEIDGQAVDLAAVSRQVVFAAGAGGLPTMKIAFVFQAKLDFAAGAHQLSYPTTTSPAEPGGRRSWFSGGSRRPIHRLSEALLPMSIAARN